MEDREGKLEGRFFCYYKHRNASTVSLISLILWDHWRLEREISFFMLSALPGKFPFKF